MTWQFQKICLPNHAFILLDVGCLISFMFWTISTAFSLEQANHFNCMCYCLIVLVTYFKKVLHHFTSWCWAVSYRQQFRVGLTAKRKFIPNRRHGRSAENDVTISKNMFANSNHAFIMLDDLFHLWFELFQVRTALSLEQANHFNCMCYCLIVLVTYF
jgi:hypothetical protein